MRDSLRESVEVYASKRKSKKIFRKFAQVMSCIVAFVTTYALILPAITMEKPTYCGAAEHTHSESCYQQRTEQRDLICTLSTESHKHGDTCYETPEPVPHSHSDGCLVTVKGALICQEEIREGHYHAGACYLVTDELLCSKVEGHLHGDSCYTTPLVCTASTDPHYHSDGCYVAELICTEPEEHGHEDACWQRNLCCGKADGEVHQHNDSCYGQQQLICNLDENHAHGNSCYRQELTCQIPESDGHAHGDTCYLWDQQYGCGLEEGQPERVAPILVCQESEEPAHSHEDACYQITMVEAEPVCGQDHEHTHTCYPMLCVYPEHTHSSACYADNTADVESRKEWEATMKQVELTDDWRANVLAIAESQLGYKESTRNYIVSEDGSTQGYTRYGAWYGIPYGDWCAMFASFCVNYAGVEGMPIECGVVRWIQQLTDPEVALYRTAAEYTPIPGDLVFFDWEQDGKADHVGIAYEILEATETEKAKLKTIEGNSADRVQYVTYDLDDPVLFGYGVLPEKPLEPVLYCGLEVHIHERGCYDENWDLICQEIAHEHSEACLEEEPPAPEEPTYYCGQEAHIHDELCYDDAGDLICDKNEHMHLERCLQMPMTSVGYYCGLQAHAHDETCFNEAEEQICGAEAHNHTSVCRVNLSDLDWDLREQVLNVIRMIDEIPSADELFEKMDELAEAGDEEAEEQWLTETYQQIALAYHYYSLLDEELQSRVINADKLMELDFVWSRVTLASHTFWLDGTNGGMTSLNGAANTKYTRNTGEKFTLPTEWKSPTKYSYTIRGWYDIYNRKYYNAGDTVTITSNTVFYADWKASTYNIGVKNENTVESISTKDFITTHIFDYSPIFNMYSVEMDERNIENQHDENWNIVSKGKTLSDGSASLGIVLRDWDTGGTGINSYPANSSQSGQEHNYSKDPYDVIPGLYYTYNMYDLFFDPNTHYMGKDYLGKADYLFQYNESTGYYYYNSAENAASYDYVNERFYVYDYLERTSASVSNNNVSDFLPFNSPYANNPSGHAPQKGTSSGKTTYLYDALTDTSGMTGTNFWFGMTMEIEFFLPDQPGTAGANKSTHGTDMVFNFSGDDDVFVLVDNAAGDQLILDIGGLHTAKSGSINFSTGVAIVDGDVQNTSNILKSLSPGKHTLTLCYMERGSSMSNCMISFNLSPRYTLAIEKEDLLSGDLLDGAVFGVYQDEACTKEAELWTDYEAYQKDQSSTNLLEIVDGTGTLWGVIPEKTYYIKEISAPADYPIPDGVIKLEMNMNGAPSVEMLHNTSPGFTVQAPRQNNDAQKIELSVTNSYFTDDTTEVYVKKKWEGSVTEPVTVRLLADGQWIRDVVLSDANGWTYTWTNLPKSKIVMVPEGENGALIEKVQDITYTVQENTVSGYTSKVTETSEAVESTVKWVTASSFEKGNSYLIKTNAGYLSGTGNGLEWVDEAAAKASTSTLWYAAEVNQKTITLVNEAGYYLRANNGNTTNNRYFRASKDAGTVTFTGTYFAVASNSNYYMTANAPNNYGYISAANRNGAAITLVKKEATVSTTPLKGIGYLVTNTPLTKEKMTSLTVDKVWSTRNGEPITDSSVYQDLRVPVKLMVRTMAGELPEGEDLFGDITKFVDTGQTAVLTSRNDWKHTFTDLPAVDADENMIYYTVMEDWDSEDWSPQVSVVHELDGSFTAQINNVYSYMAKIPVQKVWDSQITDLSGLEVEFRLYAVDNDTKEVTQVLPSVFLNAKNNWETVFKVLPPEEANVQYYLYENAVGFTPVYEHTDTIFINGKLQKVGLVTFQEDTGQAIPVVVTNYVMQELPKTGGSGVTPYTTAGLLLMAIALYLLYNKFMKCRKEDFILP